MGNTINQSAAEVPPKASQTTSGSGAGGKHASPQQLKTQVSGSSATNSPSPAEIAAAAVKSADAKLNEIYTELKRLEYDALAFEGTKSDKKYVKLEEFLTICLLKLDEIDRSDETVNQRRKKLINFCHEISDNLEKKAVAAAAAAQQQLNSESTSNQS
jgi:hypothetical protein